MNRIADQAKEDVERRLAQAVMLERQERMTRTMVVLHEWGFSYARIVEGVRQIFTEHFTVPAVKMRVRAWRRRHAEGFAAAETAGNSADG